MNPVALRRAALADLPLVLSLDQQIFAGGAYSEQQWSSEFNSPAVSILIAVVGEDPVGFCSVAKAGDDCEIRKIAVLPQNRRMGIARELLRGAFQAFGHSIGSRCLIDVAAHNDQAIKFYEAEGFIELARRKRYYADGDDAILMQKILSVL